MRKRVDKEHATLIGHNRMGKPVYFSDYARHLMISGTTGVGKSVTISNPIKHAIENKIGLLLIDGKGDTGKDSLAELTMSFCTKYNRPSYVIDMNDPVNSAKYNPLKGANETVAKDMLVNMTDWSEEHYKANAERYIQRLIKLMNLAEIPLSFHSIIQNMTVDKFECLSAILQKGGMITKEQHLENLELTKACGKIAEQAAARFAVIAESEMGQIFDENGVDIYTALQEGAAIIFILNPLLYPETAAAMGRLALIDAKKAVSKMFQDDKRYFFVCDEISVYASKSLIDLVNKSRSAGVTCILATQSLADLVAAAGEAFKHQVIENCNNYIVMRQNSYADAEEWAKTIGTKEQMQMTFQMTQSEATGLGSARMVRGFKIHPDTIKDFGVGEAVYLSRDNGIFERIKIVKPF